jgi:hypothetical protein
MQNIAPHVDSFSLDARFLLVVPRPVGGSQLGFSSPFFPSFFLFSFLKNKQNSILGIVYRLYSVLFFAFSDAAGSCRSARPTVSNPHYLLNR